MALYTVHLNLPSARLGDLRVLCESKGYRILGTELGGVAGVAPSHRKTVRMDVIGEGVTNAQINKDIWLLLRLD